MNRFRFRERGRARRRARIKHPAQGGPSPVPPDSPYSQIAEVRLIVNVDIEILNFAPDSYLITTAAG
ncbi:hypothetical protein D1AOALGA4SA_9947 [Olavius algarvensis Delta 1 endosymbiont]|nr:hypothetical protein D1AOALGA4SA_9947 [Olavius algarvensis Delta 1 endosymbiont]